MYQLQNSSAAIANGRLINGSSDSINYLYNNGGKDYFGNAVSDFDPPNIGAYNGNTLNILDTDKDGDVIAYPTATTDKLIILIREYNGPVETNIYNLSGDFQETQFGEEISLLGLKKGVYILEVKFRKESRELKVIRL